MTRLVRVFIVKNNLKKRCNLKIICYYVPIETNDDGDLKMNDLNYSVEVIDGDKYYMAENLSVFKMFGTIYATTGKKSAPKAIECMNRKSKKLSLLIEVAIAGGF